MDTTETRDKAAGGPAQAALVRVLMLVHHPDERRIGEHVLAGRGPLDLGRAAPTFPGGPLDDPGISRRHAVLESRADGALILRDLDSKNGTFLDGRRVRGEAAVGDGGLVQVGEVVLRVQDLAVPRPGDADVPAIAGHGDAARRLRADVARCAPRPAAVLVRGESGTGKELVARAIASLGRPRRAFLPFNAAAAPAALVESLLFGHVRGAFTGAVDAQAGIFRAADGGTLFLDEVGELPPDAQAKLLRAVEEGHVLPLGGTRPVPVDVRIVAATHRDLLAEVREGRFRADLYARLAQLEVACPPLRDRLEDVPLLARRFAGGRPPEAAAAVRLMQHPWPFNVRELQAIVEEALAAAPATGPFPLARAAVARLEENDRHFAREHAPATLSREALEAALARADGNVTRAAAALGKDRAQLYRIAKRLGVDL